jgi:hypothetical protein
MAKKYKIKKSKDIEENLDDVTELDGITEEAVAVEPVTKKSKSKKKSTSSSNKSDDDAAQLREIQRKRLLGLI